MRISVFGAGGRTGRRLVAAALREGWEVLAQGPGPFPPHERLQWTADLPQDPAGLRGMVEGADAVVLALGARQGGLVETTGRVLEAMTEVGTRRLLCVSACLAGEPPMGATTPFRLLAKALRSRHGARLEERDLQASLVRESRLDWTLARPTRLVDAPATGRWRANPVLPVGVLSTCRTGDLADFLLEEIAHPAFQGMAPVVRS